MAPEDRDSDTARDAAEERLAEFLVREIAPSLAPALHRKYGFAIPEDELPGIFDEAAVRMISRVSRSEPPLEDPDRLGRLFYAVCRNVAREIIHAGWSVQRRQERVLPSEVLDEAGEMGGGTSFAISAGPTGEPEEPLSPRESLVREAIASLSRRDQEVLGIAASSDGHASAKQLAAELGISHKRGAYGVDAGCGSCEGDTPPDRPRAVCRPQRSGGSGEGDLRRLAAEKILQNSQNSCKSFCYRSLQSPIVHLHARKNAVLGVKLLRFGHLYNRGPCCSPHQRSSGPAFSAGSSLIAHGRIAYYAAF